MLPQQEQQVPRGTLLRYPVYIIKLLALGFRVCTARFKALKVVLLSGGVAYYCKERRIKL